MLMKRQGKKAIIFLVIWCLVLSLMPSLVFAEEAPDADAAAAGAAEEAAEPEDEKLQEPEQKKAEKDPAPKDDQKTEPAEGQEEEPTAGSEAAAEKSAQTEEAPHLMNAPLLKAAPSISFQSYAQAGCRQFWSTGGEGFVGTCCQPGVSPDDSGTATMSKFDNASLTAKLAYQYGCKNNWIRSYAVLDGFQDLTNAARFMYMIQMSQVGINQWNGWAIDNNFSQRVRTNAIDMYNSAVSAVANLSVPEGFECYLCYPASGHQRFILYKYVEPVKTGFAKVIKKAGVPGDLASLSGYTLAGAKYQVYTNADCTTRASAADGSNALFTTSSSGESQLLELHVGDYWLKEAANPRGYAMDQTKTAFTVTAGSVSEKAVAVNVKDRPVYGTPNFRVYKTDTTGTFQWDKIGRAAFTVKYYDVANKADIAGAKPERTWTFTTSEKAAPESAPAGTKWSGFDWKTDRAENGSDKFYEDDSGNRVIPLGWFMIEEVTPPRGFMLTDEVFYGHVYLNSSGAVATDLEKADSDGRLNMKIFIFRDKQYKTKVHKTNASGAELAGAKLQILQGSEVKVGTWTTTTSAKEIGGLLPGTYTLREVKAPYGYDLAGDVSFTVASDKNTEVTMKNTPVTIRTTAVSAVTGKHAGARKSGEKITDTIHMTGLVSGRKYKVTGKLMNKRTNAAVPNVTVSPKEFTATAAAMDVTMDFTFDSTALSDGDSVVVYETLYRTSAVYSGETIPPDGIELVKHEDINDKSQTVIYPGILTAAVDQTTGTKNMLASKNAVIKDTVTYKGLIAGETYTLEGEIFDKTANRLTGIKSTANLTPASAVGTAEITFRLDAGGLENHVLVVYETLKLKGEVLAEHKKPDDTAQTIYVPQVRTTLTDKDSKDHVSNADSAVTLNDSVVCSNLIAGRTYTIEGKLVYRDSGSDVLDNGSTVKAAKTFTAANTTETQTLTFTFNGSLLEGKTVVAFEDLFTEKKKVGTHADLSDKDQSVYFPKIRTTAAISGDNHVITDTISYENILPDRKYVFRGWLVDTATGEKISGSDGRVELRAGSGAGGSVQMKMDTAGYDNMPGHSMTAFEELCVIESAGGKEKEIKVAEHKDRRGDASVNPQIIEIYQDLKVKKNVTGNLGDLSKVFEYTAEFKGLTPGQPYKIEGDDVKTFMADASGKASAGIRLKDGQTAVIRNLPKGATYKVTEAASDHIAEYKLFSEDMEDKGAKIVKAEDSNGADAGKTLATALETVDQFDGTVVILWENNRDLATLTGVGTYTGIWAAALAAVLMCLAALLILIKKRYDAEDV